MRNNSVIIASNASFIVDMLREKLRDADFHVSTAATDSDLTEKIKAAVPRFIFIEHCFHGYGTDAFVQRLARHNRTMRIAVWAASEVKPLAAARFIMAGAESFFSLRDSENNIETIIKNIMWGQHYCPADVKAVLAKPCAVPAIGEGLSKREVEIIKMAVDGKTNKEIAGILSLTTHTVKFHKANIYRKCGGNTPLDILKNGIVKGIINSDDF